ncbi:MAG: sialate O-acetylesterase [Candidatus Methylacidiphilales bacterium]|nr:sialate O-acetylesterase [Candidatus Methylacidiphilales bacterium]
MKSASHMFPCRLAFLLMLASCTLRADVVLPRIFSDHAVLQKSASTPVWGKAEPGEKVRVSLGSTTAETVAGQDGKWHVNLDLSKPNTSKEPEASVLVVEGRNKVEVKDVLVGEVWLCSGQSNMEFVLARTIDAEKEVAGSTATQGRLREFKVGRKQVPERADNLEGAWTPASPATAGRFSAVAYSFGRKLQSDLTAAAGDGTITPVGLITSSVGATPCEAWTSYQALSTDPDLKQATDRDIKILSEYPDKKKAYTEAYKAWETKYQLEDKLDNAVAESFASMTDKTGWKKAMVPGASKDAGITQPGAVWFYRSFDIPANQAGKDLKLVLGNPVGFETVYWDGKRVFQRTLENYRGEGESREYALPARLITPGKHKLAVRLYSPLVVPQMTGKISFAGEWVAKVELAMPPLSDEARNAVPAPLEMSPDAKKTGSFLYNGMIDPLIPYGITGAIWYQGENNAERAWQYRKAFPLMIKDWRSHWGQGDFPFYFCQLANYHAKSSSPGDNDWAELRDAQSSALTLSNTGMAVLIDVGEAADIHPQNKKDAGERLAAIALARTYGKAVSFSGPVLKTAMVDGSRIRLQFNHADGGLLARELPETHVISSKEARTEKLVRNSPGSPLEGFAICGTDRRWVWANATIEGDTVIVEAPSVPQPKFVRYAWAKNPTCNLYNAAGFPASPFRTDDFPATTVDKKY